MSEEVPPLVVPPGPLVDTDWLSRHLEHPRVVVLDTRGRVPAPGDAVRSLRDEFAEGHVPGAQFIDWNETFIDVDAPAANQLAMPDRFAAAAGALGIGSHTLVVAYDDYHSIFAARVWWAFRAMGHDAVRVLDGGWTAWQAEARPVERDERPRAAAAFTPRPRPELVWSIEQVAAREPDVVLVDARSRERFAGTGSDPVGGHIPGAVNAPYAELVGADGHLRPAEELRAVLAAAGIDPDDPPTRIVASCGSGISASVPLLALEVLQPGAGTRAAVYDGSWAEWSRSGLPIAVGADPG